MMKIGVSTYGLRSEMLSEDCSGKEMWHETH